MSDTEDHHQPEAVAVVGMAGRFPGADSVAELWRNQLAGEPAITFFSAEELRAEGVDEDLLARPEYVRARGLVDAPELFDAELFGLSPREAEVMDPQNRLFLETCWQAAEDAGYDLRAFDGRAGVYAGANLSTYLLANLLGRPDVVEKVGELQVRVSNDKDSLTTWVAYKLDLRGPTLSVQCGCSTSLAAVHLACQGLLDGDCDLALAGGVALGFPHRTGYLYQEGGILSADGRCRPFDAGATGTVPGTGVGAVVLKRLSDALADGDAVRAVIRGVAITNDGAQKAGYTAPGVEGQMRVVAEALSIAEVDPRSVGYVETHGSGTRLGDPIELEALVRAFRHGTDERGFCALGAVKAGIGHLDSAAGIAGLIKTVCALEAAKIPPMIHFERANPELGLEESPFYVPAEAREWRRNGGDGAALPRRAGVSSFGIGGTNVHAVLEEAPERAPGSPSRRWQQLLLSARSESALEAAAGRLADHLAERLEAGEAPELADVAFTLKVGRRPFRHRLAVVCRDLEDAVAALRGGEGGRRWRSLAPAEDAEEAGVAFLFPGLGDHHPGMARELYRREEVFRAAVDECAEILRSHLGLDLREALFPAGAGVEADPDGGAETEVDAKPDLRRLMLRAEEPESEEERRLGRTLLAQPAVFVVEYALARLLTSWGLRPKAMIGYSLGEYVAACLAGVFDLPEALALVAERARMIDELPAGAMLAVPLTEEELRPRLEAAEGLDGELSISALNGASLTVVGGPGAAVEAFAERLEAEGVACRQLRTTHAFHSSMMEPIREPFARRVARAVRHAPEIPFLSNVTGTWIRAEEATDPAYWARHLVQPVRFTDGLGELLGRQGLALLEVGPGQALTTLTRQHPARSPAQTVVATLRDRREGGSDQASLLAAVARLWAAGVAVDWRAFYGDERRLRVPLPTYPFERKRFWIEPGAARAGDAIPSAAAPAERKKADLADWAYLASWRRTAPARWAPAAPAADTSAEGSAQGPWLLFLDGAAPEGAGLGARLAERLRAAGERVVAVEAGAELDVARAEEGHYVVAPGRRADYGALLQDLELREALPRRVMHLWCAGPAAADDGPSAAERHLERGFYSLLFLAQALGERHLGAGVDITVVASGLHEVVGGESLCPARAAILGPCQVIAQEYPQIGCRSVDLELGAEAADEAGLDRLAADLLAEAAASAGGPGGDAGEAVLAYRGRHRWARRIEPIAVGPAPRPLPGLRQGGVYLVTGGREQTAAVFAEHLARSTRGKVALLTSGDPGVYAELAERLEPLAEDVVTLAVDWSEPASVAAAVAAAHRRFGALHGVLHTASVPDSGVVQLKSRDAAEAVLAPKVAGTLALEAALEEVLGAAGERLDFLALFSASSAVLGGIGQVACCAANAFLDAFAVRPTALAERVFSLGWDAFRWETHEGSDALPEALAHQLQENLETFGIEAGEATELFDRLLATSLGHALVSGRDLPVVLAEFERLKSAEALAELGPADPVGHSRPELATPYREPTTETEQTLVGLWQDAFGVDRVGVDDNFFELEGNSLMAVQIVTRLRSVFEVELPMSALFENPTVAGLGAEIDALRGGDEVELEDVDSLLAEIEGLSSEEAELQLAMEKGEA